STSLMTNTATTVQLPGNTKYEVYDYPGLYGKKADGDALTKVRMEEEEAAHDVVSGAGTCTTFSPGLKFTLKSHASSAEKGKSYALTSVSQWPREGAYDGDDWANQDYANPSTCIPAAAVFRPSRTTRKPVVQGPQTAVVVGPKGEEIYTDKYG